MDEIYNISISNDTTISSSWVPDTIDWNTTSPNFQLYSTSNWYPTTVYLYQITCPRCKTNNWAEVDKIVGCKGKLGKRNCAAKLKAVKEVVDYEISVD